MPSLLNASVINLRGAMITLSVTPSQINAFIFLIEVQANCFLSNSVYYE